MTIAARNAIVAYAEGEVGPQTRGSQKVLGYWRDVLPISWTDAQVRQYADTKQWCGGFALRCLRAGGIAKDLPWRDGAGFIGPARLPLTALPKPGDVAYTHSPFQHHAIVHSLEGIVLTTIDGNQPDCRKRVRPVPAGIQFYSIESLFDDFEPHHSHKTLRYGCIGEDVRHLQELLNRELVLRGHPNVPLAVDGLFFGKTDTVVRALQDHQGLKDDGVVGPKTWGILE